MSNIVSPPEKGTPSRVVVFGAGSLGRALCCSLAAPGSGPLRVTVVGRSAERAGQVAYLAGVRARLSGAPVVFEAERADLGPAPSGADALARLLDRTSPTLVVICASRFSPWERTRRPSAWTDLVASGGFGLALPLQADLAVRVSSAVARARPDARVVNACFPDAVNPVLAALGLPVLCGVGNAGLVHASLQHALGISAPERLKVLAHHVHLHAPSGPEDEALAWLDDAPVPDVSAALSQQRGMDRELLNLVTGHAAARLVTALADGSEWNTSVPGPWGLPGGYPVRVHDGGLTLDLPPGFARERAVAWNRRVGRPDGVDVRDGEVVFVGRAREALRSVSARIAEGFPVADLDRACEELEAVRNLLRAAPAG
ncbi:hypothetical protein JBE04_02470 [Streptomyces sp. PRKS01-29]|nr:hypothetical protein [Streptomyces sabulosicollis]MBI0293383.1 hypothetical protein [Streptomyces sabulosicollis]